MVEEKESEQEREREQERVKERERKRANILQADRVRVCEEEEQERERERRRKARESAFLIARSKRERDRKERFGLGIRRRSGAGQRDNGGKRTDFARHETMSAALHSPLANRTRARVKVRTSGDRVRVELSGKFAHLANGVYSRTDVHLDSVPGAQVVYTKDGTLQPSFVYGARWLGIYLGGSVGSKTWFLGDLVRTADTFAFAAAEGILRPEDVHTWKVRENDGGADGGEWVERNGYVITAV